MFQPLFQAVRLHREDHLRAPAAFGSVLGDEWLFRDLAFGDVRIGGFHFKGNGLVARCAALRICGEPPALLREQLQIDDGGAAAGGKGRALREQAAVFRDEVMAAKYHIGRRFAAAGVGIDVGADEPRGLPHRKRAAVLRFADGLVARREVRDDERSRKRVGDGGRLRHPEVLADLSGEAETVH